MIASCRPILADLVTGSFFAGTMMNSTAPFALFNEWYEQEVRSTTVAIPTACCLSTIGLDGFPGARTVSLKEVVKNSFIITCPMGSRKAREIAINNRVALTFWWTATERQVRVQGRAIRISDKDADRYFAEREHHTKILSWASDQGEPLADMEQLRERYRKVKASMASSLERPGNWGGFSITPIRIEFMQFRHDRFHERRLFEWTGEEWSSRLVQP